MKKDFANLAGLYRDALLDDVIPFWERHSVDHENGGYYTCLDRGGHVYDTDKFVWLQARQVWTFSMLYNRLDRRLGWLEMARHGAEFLKRHGMDEEGNWYFSLTREGRPLTQPYNLFSDCFAAMALSQYALASGDDEAAGLARTTYGNILERKANPSGRYIKKYPGTRPMISLALPMILANLSVELEELLDPQVVKQATDECIGELFNLFLDKEAGLLHENVSPDGSPVDCFEGRLINPGHGIEAMWFVMDIAERHGDDALANRAVDIILRILEFAWDDEHEGLFYFMDIKGNPPQQLEWDQKLWWVHLETLVALAMAWRLTGREACWNWYLKVHQYAWAHFPDPIHGEWFGYLNRQGQALLSLKGGKWKGCFHVPRGLYMCMRQFEALARK